MRIHIYHRQRNLGSWYKDLSDSLDWYNIQYSWSGVVEFGRILNQSLWMLWECLICSWRMGWVEEGNKTAEWIEQEKAVILVSPSFPLKSFTHLSNPRGWVNWLPEFSSQKAKCESVRKIFYVYLQYIHIHTLFAMHTHERIVFAPYLTSLISSMALCLIWQVFCPKV